MHNKLIKAGTANETSSTMLLSIDTVVTPLSPKWELAPRHVFTAEYLYGFVFDSVYVRAECQWESSAQCSQKATLTSAVADSTLSAAAACTRRRATVSEH